MDESVFSWIFFLFIIGIFFAIDLRAHRTPKAPSISSSIAWSLFWIVLALLFNLWIYYQRGLEDALMFLAGYIVERSLSLDNLFVFLLIFNAFNIPHKYRYKVLFWGILGALVMRAIFITLGVALLVYFHWVLYIFGIFLIYTGIKLIIEMGNEIHPEQNPFLRWILKKIPFTLDTSSGNFILVKGSKIFATPLLLSLIAVEISDLIFAVDSIPAILGITTDPFLVYTSNIFAIFGLRSLYFVLDGMISAFHYLHYGLAAILIFIGIKMLLINFYPIPVWFSLIFIILAICISILASLFNRE